jgi:hypothetical protein
MDVTQFNDDGRTFTCKPESSPATPGVLWWWIGVSGDNQRYAAFRAEKGDTAASLKPRIIKYYAEVLAIRARPRITRPPWNQRKPVVVAAPAAEAVPEKPAA